MVYRGQNVVNLVLFGVAAAMGIALMLHPESTWMFPIFALLSLLFGVMLTSPSAARTCHRHRGYSIPTPEFRPAPWVLPWQQAADHRRRAGRVVRVDPCHHYVRR